jgi:hypothetical protein
LIQGCVWWEKITLFENLEEKFHQKGRGTNSSPEMIGRGGFDLRKFKKFQSI